MKKNYPCKRIISSASEKKASLFCQAKSFRFILRSLILITLLPPVTYAHRSAEDQADPCRIHVGYEWIHFSAYTPEFTGNKTFCKTIPNLGMTNLVFDYEGKKLRNVSIEFEVTKLPEGTRIFYRAPDKSKTGTVDGTVDFKQFGPGNYLAHVTIVDKDKKLDTHVPFSVGIENNSFSRIIKYLLTFLVCAVIIYFSIKALIARKDRARARAPSE